MSDSLIATRDEFLHGLRCMDCDKDLIGHGYSKRLVGVSDEGEFTVELVCVECAQK